MNKFFAARLTIVIILYQIDVTLSSSVEDLEIVQEEVDDGSEQILSNEIPQGKIIGGDSVSYNNSVDNPYPYLVSVQAYNPLTIFTSSPIYNYSHICGGTVLSATKILTAAHCVQSDITTMSIYAGVVNYKHDLFGQRISVASCIKNPDFSPAALNSIDLAVCTLSNSLILGRQVQAIVLNDVDISAGTTCQFMGWGATDWNPVVQTLFPSIYDINAFPVALRTTSLTTVAIDACNSRLTNIVVTAANHICADGGWFFWKSGCSGDGGGPLICNGKQAGLLSFGTTTCGIGVPGLFINIKTFKDTWILLQL